MLKPLIALAALCGLSFSAAAQSRVTAQLGDRLRAGVTAEHRGFSGRSSRVILRYRPPSVGGYWKSLQERIWQPGYWQRRHVPARWGWKINSPGRRFWGLIRSEHWGNHWVAGRWITRTRRVWVSY